MPSSQSAGDRLQETVEALQKLLRSSATSAETARHAKQLLAILEEDMKKAAATAESSKKAAATA
jgi:hypothetical protein